jgi:ATP-independent RNA helicase DbpA
VSRLEAIAGQSLAWGDTPALLATPDHPVEPARRTLCIAGGRKDKVRPGDVLGALTGEAGLAGSTVGKIDLFEFQCYVAVNRDVAQKALKRLEAGKIKGRKFRVRMV